MNDHIKSSADHIADAKRKVEKAYQEADDVRLVVESVGQELAGRSRLIYSRSDYDRSIGGLQYNAPAAEVQALLDLLPAEPLEYRKIKPYAGVMRPIIIPIKDNEQVVEQVAASPFWCSWDTGEGFGPNLECHWYTRSQHPELPLISVKVDLADPYTWVQHSAKRIELTRYQEAYWSKHVECKFKYAKVSTSAAANDPRFNQHAWLHYTYWWEQGFTFAEVIQQEEQA